MTPRRDISADDLATSTVDSRSLALARIISQVLSPPLVGIVGYLLLGIFLQATVPWGMGWVMIALLIQMLPLLGLYLVRRRQGKYSDADVSVRHERNELYIVGTLSVLLTIVVLVASGGPQPLISLTIGVMALGVVCGLINLVWKISMHAAAIATIATAAMVYNLVLGAVLWVCALAVGWARVRTRNHTPLQVLAGFGAAALVIFVTFSLFGF